jgi:hypothetical protein
MDAVHEQTETIGLEPRASLNNNDRRIGRDGSCHEFSVMRHSLPLRDT